jgi:prepilin-type N-terminal cleavage/methylation domain-containing protein
MRSGRRTAFTLIELLVVLAIIGTLMAIILPAIQKARDAMNKILCRNRQKQLVTALHNYHGDHTTFPAGTTQPGKEVGAPNDLDSGTVLWRIQNYIELNRTDINVSAKVLYCPSRRTMSMAPFRTDFSTRDNNGGPANNNCSTIFNSSTRGVPLVLVTNGDGTSYTAMLSHKFLNSNEYTPGGLNLGDGLWWDNTVVNVPNGPPDTVTSFLRPIVVPIRDDATTTSDKHTRMGSPHVGGMTYAMADGSIRISHYDQPDAAPGPWYMFFTYNGREDVSTYFLD